MNLGSRLRPAGWRLDSVGRPESGAQILYLVNFYIILYNFYIFIFLICLQPFCISAQCDVKANRFGTLALSKEFFLIVAARRYELLFRAALNKEFLLIAAPSKKSLHWQG